MTDAPTTPTSEDNLRHGWDIFEHSERGFEIERIDEEDVFASDHDAREHVYNTPAAAKACIEHLLETLNDLFGYSTAQDQPMAIASPPGLFKSPPPEAIYIRLDFHEGAEEVDRDNDHAYIFEKLDELIAECSAFKSYKVLTDEDKPPTRF
jgi:hypothetical protein